MVIVYSKVYKTLLNAKIGKLNIKQLLGRWFEPSKPSTHPHSRRASTSV